MENIYESVLPPPPWPRIAEVAEPLTYRGIYNSGIQRPLKAIQEKSQSIYIPRASLSPRPLLVFPPPSP